VKRILEGLNEEQKRAVEEVRGPVCILAGAGSGKTTTITRRIANQVASKAFAATEILAVTFTDKAAGEMRTRLDKLGVPDVSARTFHSAALAQLRVLAAEKPPEILPSRAVALRQIANTLPKPYRFRAAGDLATEIERAKNRRIGPDKYLASLGSHEPPIPSDLMASVYKRYEEGKRERNLIDFEDLLELAIQLFKTDEYAREKFVAKYKAFTVDEYQDVNLLQETLLRQWLAGRDDICVVGDDYQSIYGFTGATPKYLLDMSRQYPKTVVLKLESNYRSTPEVLQLANKLVPKLGGAEKVLVPTRPSGSKPVVRSFARAGAELSFLVERIQALHKEGVPLEQMAVLYRVNFRSEDYEEALAAANIPYQVRDGAFLARQTARQMLTSIKRSKATGVAAGVRNLAQRAGWLEELPEDLGDRELTRQGDLSRFVRLAEEFDDGTRSMAEFAADVAARFGSEGEGRGVNLLTLHRAKGLEFEAVFIPRVEDGELPFKRAGPKGVGEERRLLYVGITRAKSHLAVTCVNDQKRRPSPFFRELSDAPTPAGLESKRRRPLVVEEINAEPGLELEIPGGFEGKIVEIHEGSVAVELENGRLMVVRFGERVNSGGKTLPLAAPKTDHQLLVDVLRKWRLERARSDDVPAYVIFHDSTIDEIARARPESLDELGEIDGLGPVKLERYGAEVLEVLKQAEAASVG
jgi:DNA helicase II / ATP-dependent DNA helicase PcrA